MIMVDYNRFCAVFLTFYCPKLVGLLEMTVIASKKEPKLFLLVPNFDLQWVFFWRTGLFWMEMTNKRKNSTLMMNLNYFEVIFVTFYCPNLVILLEIIVIAPRKYSKLFLIIILVDQLMQRITAWDKSCIFLKKRTNSNILDPTVE